MVVPEFNNNPNDEMFNLATGEGDSLEVYPAKKDYVIVGYAVKTYSNKGFQRIYHPSWQVLNPMEQ